MDLLYAMSAPRSKKFMAELLELCRKHRLAIVPTHNHEVSLHDYMMVTEFDESILNFYEQTGIPDAECV